MIEVMSAVEKRKHRAGSENWECRGGEVGGQNAVFNRLVRTSLLEKVTCDQRLEEGGRASQISGGGTFQRGRGNSLSKAVR